MFPSVEDRADPRKCNYIAFSDDLVLVSSTNIGMTRIMEQLVCAMADIGLKMKPFKCASLRKETHSSQKQWIVNSTPNLKVQHQDIQETDISQTYKYLGIKVGPILKLISLKENCRICSMPSQEPLLTFT